MLLCRVTGSVISTRKNEKLTGSKFMIVEPLSKSDAKTNAAQQFVAVDNVGAGIGETVLVACGSAARLAFLPHSENMPVDAAIVGIVDEGTY